MSIKNTAHMSIKLKHVVTECIYILLSFTLVFDVLSAPKLIDCKKNLELVEMQELKFGNFVSSVAGTITVSASGSRSESPGITLVGGEVSAGVIYVSSKLAGCDIYPVHISYKGVSNLVGPGTSMPVNTFTSNPSSPIIISPLVNVPIAVSIGGSLDSAGGQAAGVYTGGYIVDFKNKKK